VTYYRYGDGTLNLLSWPPSWKQHISVTAHYTVVKLIDNALSKKQYAANFLPHFTFSYFCVCCSVPNPWHFGRDPDPGPDPWIPTLDLWVRIRLRILLFSSL